MFNILNIYRKTHTRHEVVEVLSITLISTISKMKTVVVSNGYFHFGKYHRFISRAVVADYAITESGCIFFRLRYDYCTFLQPSSLSVISILETTTISLG